MKRLLYILILMAFAFQAKAQLNTDRLMSVGRNALYFEDYVLSIQYFNKVIQVKPHLAEPYFYRAVAKISLEDYVGARRDLDSVIARNPFMPMAYYARGYIEGSLKEWDAAESDIRMALEYSPDNVTYRINLINIFEATERLDSAITVLDRMIRQSPRWIELRLEKMSLILQQGDTIGAIAVADEAVESEPRNAAAYGARAVMRLITGDEDSALVDCNTAIRYGTDNPGVYINRGIINYNKKRFREAMADYDMAVEMSPGLVTALFNRALLRCELGDYNNALDDLDKLVKENPDLDEAIFQRASVNALLGNIDQAIKDYSKIIERHPKFVPAYYSRAELYEKKRDAKKAYLDREKAFKLMEDHKKNGNRDEDKVKTGVQVAKDESIVESVAGLFVASQKESETESGVRGMVQNQKMDLTNEPNFVVSYYRREKSELIADNYNPIELQEFTRQFFAGKELYLVTREVAMTRSISDYYFAEIEGLSRRIASQPYIGQLYLVRGLDYAMVQDFDNALEDLTKATVYGVDNGMVYFIRAMVRYKSWESASDTQEGKMKEKMLAKEWEMVLRDLEKAAEMMPGAGFVWYNKGNILVMKGDYNAALVCYDRALQLEKDLGEAYFNRGLTYMLLNNREKAISDMSRAGEMGIYRAYRILKELR